MEEQRKILHATKIHVSTGQKIWRTIGSAIRIATSSFSIPPQLWPTKENVCKFHKRTIVNLQ
eukprot:scaffold14504_cov111-Cylindrotheca_fusiformis.AAC.2